TFSIFRKLRSSCRWRDIADYIRRFLGKHDDRAIDIPPNEIRKHGGVHDAKPAGSANTKLWINNDIFAIVRAHPAGAGRVMSRRRKAIYMRVQRRITPVLRPWRQLRCNEVAQFATLRKLTDHPQAILDHAAIIMRLKHIL